MVLLSALLVSVASQPTDQVVQWRRNPEHLLPSRSPQMVSRWCQDGGKGYAGRGGRANADRATWESVGWEWPPQLVARVLQGSGSQLVAGASKMSQPGQLLSREGGGRSGLGRHS